MKNQSSGVQAIIRTGNPHNKAFAIRMMMVVILVFGLLAASLSTASAAVPKTLSAQSDVPDCGAQPICGYIQMHDIAATNAASTSFSTMLMAYLPPGLFEAQLVVIEPALVRSGPGKNFFSYGELPAAFVTRVMGVSQAGNWWVIPLPFTIAPDGLGWVEAASVNAGQMPVETIDLPACGDLPICGYIQAHSQPQQQVAWINCAQQPICPYLQAHTAQNLAVLQPSYAVETMFGLPVIVVTGQK